MAKNDCIHYNQSNGCCLLLSEVSHDGGLWQPCVESPCSDFRQGKRVRYTNKTTSPLWMPDPIGYQSPIGVYETYAFEEVRNLQDELILQNVAMMGVEVDKDELLKALQYDRDQYECGYKAGFADGTNKAVMDTIQMIRTRLAVYFGTYTHDAEVKVYDVFRLIDRIIEDVEGQK